MVRSGRRSISVVKCLAVLNRVLICARSMSINSLSAVGRLWTTDFQSRKIVRFRIGGAKARADWLIRAAHAPRPITRRAKSVPTRNVEKSRRPQETQHQQSPPSRSFVGKFTGSSGMGWDLKNTNSRFKSREKNRNLQILL